MMHSTKKPVTTMLTYPWKCTVLHCNHLGNTGKPLVLMTRHFDYCPSASKGDNQSVRSSAPVISRCFPGGHNVKLYISSGKLAWWLLAFLHIDAFSKPHWHSAGSCNCQVPDTDHSSTHSNGNLYHYYRTYWEWRSSTLNTQLYQWFKGHSDSCAFFHCCV